MGFQFGAGSVGPTGYREDVPAETARLTMTGRVRSRPSLSLGGPRRWERSMSDTASGGDNKAVRQRSDLLFIATSFWFEESPCAVRTNSASLDRLCTLFGFSTLLIFEHMHAVLSTTLVLCSTVVTTKHCCYE